MKQKTRSRVPEELRRGMTTDKTDGKVDGNYTDDADGKIEAKAVRKLQQPSRSQDLVGFLD